MTKGIISPEVASLLHKTILPTLGTLAFTIHTSFAIRLAFNRWGIWNKFTKIMLFSTYAAMLLGFAYVTLFYTRKPIVQKQPTKAVVVNEVKPGEVTPPTPVSPVAVEPQVKPVETPVIADTTPKIGVFTAEELAKYNGKNGMASYVAIDGVVYDVSSTFKSGKHQGYTAGQDLSDAFHSQHAESILKRFNVVGAF